ncbi:type II secretory pathway protein [Limnohabitans sp.]|uniref:type II secretion system protein GspD n=1 Tax=Limnohabitans sp. TaxID=1907725 RepID=UPI00286F15FE|nr:type II secretory pathway protein [Limnohabitans sp.]
MNYNFKHVFAVATVSATLLLVSPLGFAKEPASFNFTAVSVPQVIQLIYSEVLKGSYVIDPDVLTDSRQVTFRFKPESGDLRQFVAKFLDSLGFVVETKGGVDFIHRIKVDTTHEVEKSVFVYRPKSRDANGLTRLLQPLFTGAFAQNRAIAAPIGAKVNTAVPDGSAAALIDQSSDLLVFNGSEKEIAALKSVLEQVDVPAGEVVIRTVLYEVGQGSSEGTAFQAITNLLGGKYGVTIGKTGKGDSFSVNTTNFNAVLSVLNSDNRFKQVTSPTLRLTSGVSGRFSFGDDVPTLGAVTTPLNGQPVQSIEYRQSGVILDLLPKVREAAIDLKINQQVSSFKQTQNGVNGSPTLSKRSIETTVSLKDGEIVVLGGMNQTSDANTSQGLSFMPRLLDSTSGDSNKVELLLLLQVQRI